MNTRTNYRGRERNLTVEKFYIDKVYFVLNVLLIDVWFVG